MDLRKRARRRTLKGVRASFGNHFCAVDCVLKNVSENGALVSFTDGALIPDHFTLYNEMDGYRVNCRIVRRAGNTAGVEFIGSMEPIKVTHKQVIEMPRPPDSARNNVLLRK